MIVELLTEQHLECLSLQGGCTGSSESTLVKKSNSECQTVWIQIRPDIFSGVILVKMVCKGYQQKTLVDKRQVSKSSESV